MKIYYLILLSLYLFSTTVQARLLSGDKGNGGDTCEYQIQNIRSDIKSWILNGKHKNLKLPSNVSAVDYTYKMIESLERTQINCTDEKLKLHGTVEKTCLNSHKIILCNFDRFNALNENEKYIIIHHEYAGLAGIETNLGSAESNYKISNQLSRLLKNTSVKKLNIKSLEPSLDFLKIPHLRSLDDIPVWLNRSNPTVHQSQGLFMKTFKSDFYNAVGSFVRFNFQNRWELIQLKYLDLLKNPELPALNIDANTYISLVHGGFILFNQSSKDANVNWYISFYSTGYTYRKFEPYVVYLNLNVQEELFCVARSPRNGFCSKYNKP